MSRLYEKGDVQMVGFLIAILSGALMSIQGVFNTAVTKSSSIWVANGFVQATAFAVCMGAWLFVDRSNIGDLLTVKPKYMLLGGVIGAFITFTVIKSMEMLGPSKAIMFIIISQLIVAYGIELMGLFGVDKQNFEWKKVVGMAVAIIGIAVFKWD